MPILPKSSASSYSILTLLLIPLFLSLTVRSIDDNPFLLPSYQEINNDHSICPPFDPTFCPIACIVPDPVCGVDGVTYSCGCDSARCVGVHVAYLGCCEGETDPACKQLKKNV